ncbi:dTDP-4-dehydrorhamnose reductase [Castellaniella sp. UC4442_H9]|jgi:dTDP-4-dehydrorhamnose reductase
MTPSRRPRILVTGAQGQLGHALRALAPHADADFRFTSRAELDVTQESAISRWLDAHAIDSLINAAAYTAVDRASSQPDQAMAVNARAPVLLAHACADRGIRLFHVSTDYVFDGARDRPYREDDATAPLNTYGRSKQAGERGVLSACPAAVIVRTSWVFSARGANFVRTVLRLAQDHPVLRVVADQTGGPTWTGHLAAVLRDLAVRPATEVPGGLYHFSGQPWVSWYEFAQEIFARAHALGLVVRIPTLQAIASTEWANAEPRPANSRLDCGKLAALLGPLERDWRSGLGRVLADPEFRRGLHG